MKDKHTVPDFPARNQSGEEKNQPRVKVVGLEDAFGNVSHVDMDDPVWVDIARGLNTVMDSEIYQAPKGIEMLRQAAETHGGDAMVNSLLAHLGEKDDPAFKLYWFACSGIREAIPALRGYLESNDDDVRWSAACGLAHLGEQAGFGAIEAVLDGSANSIDPRHRRSWYEELAEIDDDRARELLEKYRDRDGSGG